MKKEHKYYLKWDVDKRSFTLDVEYSHFEFAYSIRRVLITLEQAKQFANRIEYKYLDRDKHVDMNVLEFEFDRFFVLCKTCGVATSKVDLTKRQGKLCYDCYQIALVGRRKEAFKAYWERQRIIRLQTYAKTDQGIADAVGLDAIRANIKIQLAKHGKTQTDMAKMLGLYVGSVSTMLNTRKGIKIEYVYKVAEWLFVPVDLLLKMPRGVRPLKRKNKIPINIYRKPMKIIR